ncbi:glycerol-3-phosphate responsive antiterminator [Oscillospiraceae bacterium 38-13]
MTKMELFLDAMHDAPVIAAVKDNEGLERALASDNTVIFLLYGTILNISDLIRKTKAAGKMAFVHIDLIEGMSARDISADFIANRTEADGVISTHPNLIRRARELGLLTIQRFFMLDSLSFSNVLRQSSNADAVDVLPGAIPSVISHLVQEVRQPLIASGLLLEKSDVVAALSAGAVAVSTTRETLWSI